MRIRLLNAILLASDYEKLLSWYKQTFNLEIGFSVSDEYHFTELTNDSKFVIAISDAVEMGVTPHAARNNTAIPQLAVSDVADVLEKVSSNGGKVLFGPSYDDKWKLYYGGFSDIEGNQIWVTEEK